MTNDQNQEPTAPDVSVGPSEVDEPDVFDGPPRVTNADMPEPPHPVNWNLLTAHELEQEWLALNRWVDWLRRTYGLQVSVIPPFWHHHPEMVWELSALHLHWLAAYDPEQNASGPLGWHRDFADARDRLRYWVTACSTRGDRDRPTRQAAWPGEEPAPSIDEVKFDDRDEEFADFVIAQVRKRQEAEDEFYASLADDEGP